MFSDRPYRYPEDVDDLCVYLVNWVVRLRD